MSEVKSRFKIKKGEIEIEYEGLAEDVNERYKEAFDWLKSFPSEEGETRAGKMVIEEKRKGTRGPEIWSPAIDTLIQDGFFKLPNKRTPKEVIKALADKALPVTGKDAQILTALKRKVRKGDLKGTKGPEGWTFWNE
jgi:hypothetical protein